jgi:hypothetical protein
MTNAVTRLSITFLLMILLSSCGDNNGPTVPLSDDRGTNDTLPTPVPTSGPIEDDQSVDNGTTVVTPEETTTVSTPDPVGSLQVRIIELNSGNPLSEAIVTILDQLGEPVDEQLTDAAGTATFVELTTGMYTVNARPQPPLIAVSGAVEPIEVIDADDPVRIELRLLVAIPHIITPTPNDSIDDQIEVIDPSALVTD